MISTSWYFLPSDILSSWVQAGPSDWLLMHWICKNYEKSLSRLCYKRLKFILPYSLLPFSFLILTKSAAILLAPLWNIPNGKELRDAPEQQFMRNKDLSLTACESLNPTNNHLADIGSDRNPNEALRWPPSLPAPWLNVVKTETKIPKHILS